MPRPAKARQFLRHRHWTGLLERCGRKVARTEKCTFTVLVVVKDEKDDSMKLWSHNMTEFVLKAPSSNVVVILAISWSPGAAGRVAGCLRTNR